MKFAHFTSRDSSREVSKTVGLVEYVVGGLGDSEVRNLVAEERVELGNILEHGNDLGHDGADVLVRLVVRLRSKIVHVDD